MWKKILLGLAGAFAFLLVAVIIAASLRPDSMRVVRSIDVQAPPAAIYPHLVDFRRWAAWSPWDKLDPGMKRTYQGVAGSVGSSYEWAGNDQVGEGRMTLSAAQPTEKVNVLLEFLKPWQATNQVEFTLRSKGTATEVSWLMTGKNNFTMKALQLFMDMDAMIGKDFERGLVGLKQVSEMSASPAPATP